jgi:transcriptional regulator with XRE-family HTH domain
MENLEITSYLRFHRKRAGLTQGDLASLLGYLTHGQVSKHERAETLPSLLIALGYEAVFRVPTAELFPGIYETVKLGIEQRLAAIESDLQQSTVKGRGAHAIARRLEWFCERSDQ